MHAVVAAVSRGFGALAALLMGAGYAAAATTDGPRNPSHTEALTNLSQLRACAEQQAATVHPFRIVAQVCDADCGKGVLLLRDYSDVEFIALDLKGRTIDPGATVCVEAKGCGLSPSTFGLAIVPGMTVQNDGLHPMKVASGTAFLHPGANPIQVQWFNGPGDLGLTLEYEGPQLPRQSIPASVLSRARTEPAAGLTNFSPGLDYRCYEGHWALLPDFTKFRPVKSGVATNFDLGVRTRNEGVGVQFSGFISIPREGLYTFYLASDDGSALCLGEPCVDVRVLDQPPAPRLANQVPAASLQSNLCPLVTLQGRVNFVGLRETGGELQMRLGNDDIRVDVFESGNPFPNLPPRTEVSVSGIYQDIVNEDGTSSPGLLRVLSWKSVRPLRQRESLLKSSGPEEMAQAPGTEAAPVRTVAEIKALSPDRARQQIPVSIRGVATAILPDSYGAVLQDSTRGIFVYLNDPTNPDLQLKRGEFYQIDGVTGPGLFAPVIVPRRITHLGSGQLPEPLHATWAQLVNGSLDTQYVDIDGVVTAVQDQNLSLLTEGGRITLDLKNFRPEALAGYSNAVVRIRGCVFAPFNAQTRELETGTLLVGDAALSVVEPPPRDLFAVPQKGVGELLFYDPEAAPFRRLKISGQIIYGAKGEYFLAEGTNGVRITARNSDPLAAGDLVDAVGVLSLGGPAAELREAVMRKKGTAPLPAPTRVNPDQLLLARYANTLVQVPATLMNQWREGPRQVLELQSRFVAFRARLDTPGRESQLPRSGSRLELTGVYVPLGSPADQTVSGFELLLPSPACIRVLATPPWWNLRRVLALAGLLAAMLCAALVWNKALHRQAQERGRLLEKEIRDRERAEQQRAAEAERARIARDLHDELGAGLTEVSLLASSGLGEVRSSEKGYDRFRFIAEKARALVSALDVIVWAIDPKRNSLQSFADYLGSYAEEILSTSHLVGRFRIPIECDAVALPGAARHSLFLAVKEALNNVIRHAAATEVELQMTQLDHRLEIVIADNGCGFEWNALRRRNGLSNLQERLQALNGQCRIQSRPGNGTTIKFIVPLPETPGQP